MEVFLPSFLTGIGVIVHLRNLVVAYLWLAWLCLRFVFGSFF